MWTIGQQGPVGNTLDTQDNHGEISLPLPGSLQPTGVSDRRGEEGLQGHGVSSGAGAGRGGSEKRQESPAPHGPFP